MTNVLKQTEKFGDTWVHEEEEQVLAEAEIEAMNYELRISNTRTQEKTWNRFSFRVPEGTNLADTIILNF